ncbi:hypothetical protein GCM10007418_03540 [Halopseudomonas salina]|uniref:Uncharacterized protein n=1 Tax=Halopseudomonas salina TaxID=1323744 RepID=A0ABQ1NXY6_9GAMM|nr:hypothetical protein GCM10007418_03540 [Halopseudomonas salina]
MRALLLMHQVLDQTMLAQQSRHLIQTIRETFGGFSIGNRHGVTSLKDTVGEQQQPSRRLISEQAGTNIQKH